MGKTAKQFFYDWAEKDGLRFEKSVRETMLSAHENLRKRAPNDSIEIPDYLNDPSDPLLHFFDQQTNIQHRYSNHQEFSKIVETLLVRNKDWVNFTEISNIFVGVVRDNDLMALAVNKDTQIDGKLIVISEGLIHATFFLVNTYFVFIEQQARILNIKKDSIRQLELDHFFDEIIDVLKTWKISFDEQKAQNFIKKYGFKPDYFSALMTTGAFSFFTAHEIAHHLVGHTDFDITENKKFLFVLKNIEKSVNFRFPDTKKQEIKDEYIADLMALSLLIGPISEPHNLSLPELDQVLLGALASVTVSKISSSELAFDTLSHPATLERYLSLVSALLTYADRIFSKEWGRNDLFFRYESIENSFAMFSSLVISRALSKETN